MQSRNVVEAERTPQKALLQRGFVAKPDDEDYTVNIMQPVKAEPLHAVVKNGRLVLDEPTDLPEGLEVSLVVVDDEFEPEEKARLLQAIEEGIEDYENGDTVDAMEFANELLRQREALSR